VVGHAERVAGARQLDDPVPAQLVGLGRLELGQLGHVNLAFLTERAGHQRDVGAVRHVVRHRRAGSGDLVVRMGVHEQEPTGQGVVHGRNFTSSSSRSFPPPVCSVFVMRLSGAEWP
jgi:hypothetical protein